MNRNRFRPSVLVLWMLGLACLWPGLVVADPGDTAGWSTATDPRKRAFLKFVPENGGPRVLTFACLRDVDSFAVYSAGLDVPSAANAELSLVNDTASYHIRGEITPDGLGPMPTFSYETDAGAAERQQIKTALMPVLSGPGPLKLTVGSVTRELPIAGLEPALNRFSALCFGH